MTMLRFRSLLFVPGSRPERFAKAIASGADAVCIDLEDAVAVEAKAAARATVLAFCNERRGAAGAVGTARVGVRVNALRSADGLRDLAGFADVATLPDFLMLPKLSDSVEASVVAALFPGLPIWPVVETAQGVGQAAQIAAVPGIAGLLFGAVDFAAETGCSLAWEALAYARGVLAVARAAAGIQLLDVPLLDITDTHGLAASTARVRDLGFTGRACIHPVQVATVNQVFSPSADEIAAARRLIAAFDAAAGAAVLLDGKLVEKPVILAAQHVLARAS